MAVGLKAPSKMPKTAKPIPPSANMVLMPNERICIITSPLRPPDCEMRRRAKLFPFAHQESTV